MSSHPAEPGEEARRGRQRRYSADPQLLIALTAGSDPSPAVGAVRSVATFAKQPGLFPSPVQGILFSESIAIYSVCCRRISSSATSETLGILTGLIAAGPSFVDNPQIYAISRFPTVARIAEFSVPTELARHTRPIIPRTRIEAGHNNLTNTIKSASFSVIILPYVAYSGILTLEKHTSGGSDG
jgi:hypothetical protein